MPRQPKSRTISFEVNKLKVSLTIDKGDAVFIRCTDSVKKELEGYYSLVTLPSANHPFVTLKRMQDDKKMVLMSGQFVTALDWGAMLREQVINKTELYFSIGDE